MNDRGSKIRDMINNEDKNVDFMNGERPPTYLNSIVDLDEGGTEELLVRSTCYHMRHKKMLDISLKKYKSQMTCDGRLILGGDDLEGTTEVDTEDSDEEA